MAIFLREPITAVVLFITVPAAIRFIPAGSIAYKIFLLTYESLHASAPQCSFVEVNVFMYWPIIIIIIIVTMMEKS